MKKVLFVLSLLLCSMNFVSAQTPLSFSKVINADSISAKKMYERFDVFFTNAFDHPDKTIQMKDIDNKQLIIKTAFQYNSDIKYLGSINHGYISYTLNIACKDGRFKVSLSDFSHKSDRRSRDINDVGMLYSDVEVPHIYIMMVSKKWKAKFYQDMKDKAAIESEAMFLLLEKVAKQATQAQDSNW